MNALSHLSAQQLRRAAQLKDRIDSLQRDLDRVLGSSSGKPVGGRGGRRKLSAEAREKIAAAQRARWAKYKAAKKK
jgi:hypothetical protein